MKTHRFYLDISLVEGQTLALPSDIVRHMKVLRILSNSHIVLFNGRGVEYQCCVSIVSRNEIHAVVTQERLCLASTDVKISIGISLIANNKMDLVIQKATELGVDDIVPIISQNSWHHQPSVLVKHAIHWQATIVSACEQSGRSHLPYLSPCIKFSEAILSAHGIKLLLHPSGKSFHELASTPADHVFLLIGPEGGFTQEEQTIAIDNGFHTMSLSNNILRADTAAIASIAVVVNQLR